MRIGSLVVDGVQRYGIVDGDHITLLAESADVFGVLAADDPKAALTGHRLPWDPTTELAVPVPVGSIRDFITFEQHTAGSLRAVTGAGAIPDAWYEAPAFYFTNPHAAIGSGATVPMPPGCEVLDFELEVAVVIGAAGYNLTVDEAFDHVAGFTILNDWSARDLQGREMRVGLGPAKGKDTATTLGPVLVTVDEFVDHEVDGRFDLNMDVFVNGTRIGGDTLANMAWTFAELIAYASRGTWVRPGDVLGSGTCGGGCLAELWGWRGNRQPPPLRIGDTVSMTVEGIGNIHNTVIAGPPLHEVPPARRRPSVSASFGDDRRGEAARL
ncbi:2-keto-4-pentenoate hydratase/2-oxohepta-3-ene-1,7-dioic acid hydratase in catechol pathway [Rhodococcus wratislaviensis]|uniref:Fumarylacetoacetate hydrolase family protein n=1 Tax=Rhodococcus wratislaviensis TaxID=44752 RepID=A0AB38FCZ2_RHOWR|nr:fumarylacetoacetate hydrolase family protein [Rhodococcus wratislaviensis]REE75611.1 2-keto-4-pentenoate hydratase/2-oxohepta-3-ene-1,7-dioic acid hydratase in catechol pathway [Rhodococcus wratislaviensis]SPZ39353.1 fumarylacetoacetate hydrolase family protein [Rhodococcus wratislaviensis]